MYSRNNPYLAKIKQRILLNAPSSSKKTYHIVLKKPLEGFDFKVGDSIGILPQNHPLIVEEILQKLNIDGKEKVFDVRANQDYSFRDFLLYRANLYKVPFHKLYPMEKSSLPLNHLLDFHRPNPMELSKILLPLMPRFYSIASSPKMHPDEIHLTVTHVSYQLQGKMHYGVGSHFLCQEAELHTTPIPIYLQPSMHFTLPKDPKAPMILIGPGTGIAPFRAFLQDRICDKSPGKNWIFFGERNRTADFYYQDFFKQLEKEGKLKLTTAFSRDQKEKIYVQHQMLKEKKELWQWLQEGSFIYVCGDAEKMAKEVHATLQNIVSSEGRLNEEKARQFLKNLKKDKRYLLDVY